MNECVDPNKSIRGNESWWPVTVEPDELVMRTTARWHSCLEGFIISWGVLMEKVKVGGKRGFLIERWGCTFYTKEQCYLINMWLHAYSCANHNMWNEKESKEEADMYKKGNEGKNRNVIDLTCWTVVDPGSSSPHLQASACGNDSGSSLTLGHSIDITHLGAPTSTDKAWHGYG